jgi:hypothetical protein
MRNVSLASILCLVNFLVFIIYIFLYIYIYHVLNLGLFMSTPAILCVIYVLPVVELCNISTRVYISLNYCRVLLFHI